MGFVITARPICTAAPSAPIRIPVVAKFKAVKLKTKSRPKKTSLSAKKHVGGQGKYPELPPPPPQYVVIQGS
eukprot:jgi/Botrbrau1/13029/Bobra.0389s0020.1